MERKYWEKIAPGYNEEIFDVLHNDKKGIIRNAIRLHAKPAGKVIDIGCAVGKWLPVLSPLFKTVTAVDISAGNLAIARDLHPALSNVSYHRADMSAGKTTFRNYDMAVCINAILTSSQKKRNSFFANLKLTVKKGGYLVLVVPSLESWLLTRIVQNRWQIDRKLFNDDNKTSVYATRYKDILQGNAEIDQVPTKHYLEDELQLLLEREGFQIDQVAKIRYNWKTEFIRPPKWLSNPSPFDWLVTARKK